MTNTRTISPIQHPNAAATLPAAEDRASAMRSNGPPRPPRGSIDGAAATAVCNAMVAALKRVCGKGPTKVKAYGLDEHIAVVAQDMLTPLERTLVQSGNEHLVREARHVLADEVSEQCRAAIEHATGHSVVGWQSQIDPSADTGFTLVRLHPASRAADDPGLRNEPSARPAVAN
jgi:uncharacterized protein YbcI